MDEPNLGEAIQLASQADSDAVKEDGNFNTFEELARQFYVQQRLIKEGQVQIQKIDNFKEVQDVDNLQQLTKKLKQACKKSEESMQIDMICERALEASQFSLALQSIEDVDVTAEKLDEDMVESSIEYLDLCLSNLSETQHIESLKSEMKGVQERLLQVQQDISNLKTNQETNAGTKSEKIEKLESKLNFYTGRYNFSRFLTQLLLIASEEDLNDPAISELFVKCGESLD